MRLSLPRLRLCFRGWHHSSAEPQFNCRAGLLVTLRAPAIVLPTGKLRCCQYALSDAFGTLIFNRP
ncbi:hypothetical protein ABH972_005415 [Bradyrhizobium ottawaense]